jgi:hypothetical protein
MEKMRAGSVAELVRLADEAGVTGLPGGNGLVQQGRVSDGHALRVEN